MINDKTVERRLLLKRLFSRQKLYQIGKAFNVHYFRDFHDGWDINLDRATLEIASHITDRQLQEAVRIYEPRTWQVFRGQYHTFENGQLRLEGSWKLIQAGVAQAKKKYGDPCHAILECLVKSGNGCSIHDLAQALPKDVDPSPILAALEKLDVIVTSYKGEHLQEWAILEETSPIIQIELGLGSKDIAEKSLATKALTKRKSDPLDDEREMIRELDHELSDYLNDLLQHRVDEALAFGQAFSISHLAEYLQDLFGPILYFDSLLSITQQYGLANVDIVHGEGRTGMQTGWNLSLFGEPGTGKSFSVRDLILGKPNSKIPPHGIPGRNRYAGGMTPSRFIRIGQAYSKRIFNFIIPEFNDWFKYKGMVEPLKLAMEQGEIKYEMHREVIGPYRFSSFFSVNYNVAAFGRGYEVTVQDPNFSAIEDRMLCRLHRLTKRRFVEIAESQMRLAFGEIDIEEGAQQIRDHLTLIYAAETQHPLVQGRFPAKPAMLTPKAQQLLMETRRAILDEIPQEVVRFSARLEDRAIRFAAAASLLSYFQSNRDYIPVSEEALKYALQLYVEEASVRSKAEFLPEMVLAKVGVG